MAADMLRAGRGLSDPALVELVCSHSNAVLDWLRRELAVRFLDRIDRLGGHSVPRCHSVVEIQGRHIINPMLALADRLRVRLRLGTRLTGLMRDAGGAVTGIEVAMAEDPKGWARISARQAVVLAAGGFSAEAEADPGWTDADHARTSLADSTSEALALAAGVGAALVDMEHLQMLPCASPDEPGRGIAPVLGSYAVFPYGLMVDPDNGRRFVNEWTDRKTRADAMSMLARPAVGIVDGHGLAQAGETIGSHWDPAVLRRFADLDDLAEHHRIPPAALAETLQRFNGLIIQGRDLDFGKPIAATARPLTAPFFALRLRPKAHSTMGGVRIDTQARVLTDSGRPIPRLYAAGEVTGGIHGASRLACCAITECLVFGRIAGGRAALENPIEQETPP
jgi:flavocytochrome c